MYDCFVTSHHKLSPEREYFEKLTLNALQSSGFSTIIVKKPMLERYFECERLAKTEFYVLCDNDIIPATHDTLVQAIQILKNNPGYSQIGLGWRQDMSAEEGSSWIKDRTNPNLWEMDHCGGCMVIRKGTIKDLGIRSEFASGYGDDRVMGETARILGYKVGITPKLYFYHLGSNYSTFKYV